MSGKHPHTNRPESIWPSADDAQRDDLTGLPNRRYLAPRLQDLLRRSSDGRSPFCLVLVDVDHFKRATETYGRVGGDALLKALARRLENLASNNDCLVRFAGDEFALLMPGRRREEAARFAEHIRRQVGEEPFHITQGASVTLTMSLGVTEGPADGTTVRALIEAADDALEAAKQSGRDRVGVAGEISADVPHMRRVLSGFPSPRFVGRVNALARCGAMSHLGERGPTTLVLVQSATGLGRSRLVMEVARQRAESGDLTLWTSCRPELQKSPYAPLADMVRQLATRHPQVLKATIQALGWESSAILGRRFAPFSEGQDPRQTAEVSAEWRSKFFSTVMAAFGHLGREHQLALVFDDLEYADAATLKVLTFLLRHDRQDDHGAGLPIFGTVSQRAIETPPAGSAFGTFWRFVSSWPTVGVVALGPLHADEVAGIVDACFPGHRFPEELSGFVHRLTGGNPMFVQEVLIVLALSGFIQQVGPTWRLDTAGLASLPHGLQELLSKRIEMLDPETSAALSNASVLGSQFSVRLLQRVLDTNEGHATDIADQAIAHRLFVNATSGQGGRLQFTGRSIREITYDSVDEATRRRVHGKVSQLKEHFEVTDMDDALAEIAFHAERGGDQVRIAHSRARQEAAAQRLFRAEESDDYFTQAGTDNAPHIEARIAEFTTPLSSTESERLPGMLKALINVQRGIQMYPPGSQFIQNAIQASLDGIQGLMKQSQGLTIKERGGALEFNGVAFEMEAFGQIGNDVVETLRRAHVHSVTFTRALTARDLASFGEGATRFGAKGYTPREEDWGDFLVKRRAVGLGIVPKRYRATGEGATLGQATRLEGLASEAAKHLPLLKDILRFTAGTAEATLLYPKGSETVRRAVEGLEKALAQAHAYLSAINMGVTNDGFLVNDLRLDVRTFGAAVQAMHQVMSRSDAKSLSFKAGVNSVELESLFRYLGSERASQEQHLPWETRLAAQGIQRVGVDDYVFVAADAQVAPELELEEERAAWSTLTREALLQRVLEDEPESLLEGDLRVALPDLLTDLVLDEEDELVAAIVRRFHLLMQHGDASIRAGSFHLLGDLTDSTSRIVAEALTRNITDYVTVRLRLERAPDVLTSLITTAERVADLHLRAGDLRAASRIIWQLGKGLQVAPEVDDEARGNSRAAVARLMRSQPFERALHALWTPNEKRRALVLHLLEGCGVEAIDRLFQLAFQSNDAARVQIHAEQLAAISSLDDLEARLLTRVNPFDGQAEVTRALEVAELVRCATEAVLVRAFQHRQSSVLDIAGRIVARMRRVEAEPILRRLARSSEPRLRARVVQLVGEVAPRSAVGILGDYLWDESTSEELRVNCCVALGRSSDPKAVEPLEALMSTSWWARIAGQEEPGEVRTAAAWALVTLGTEEALEVLDDFRDDPEAGVREAVDSALPDGLARDKDDDDPGRAE
ncbi:MAG: diguanylate cyclase [Myxococcota bacterium]